MALGKQQQQPLVMGARSRPGRAGARPQFPGLVLRISSEAEVDSAIPGF